MREELTKLVKEAEVANAVHQMLQVATSASPTSRLLEAIDREAASAWLGPLVA